MWWTLSVRRSSVLNLFIQLVSVLVTEGKGSSGYLPLLWILYADLGQTGTRTQVIDSGSFRFVCLHLIAVHPSCITFSLKDEGWFPERQLMTQHKTCDSLSGVNFTVSSDKEPVSVRPRSGDILVVLDNSELPLKVDLVI